MPLSDKWLKSLHDKAYEGKAFLSDKEGLGAKVSPKGRVSFIYQYRFQGKVSSITMARYPDMSIKEAREWLPKFRNWIKQGINPKEAYKGNESSQGGRVTIQALANDWIKWVEGNRKPKTITLYKSLKNKYLDTMFYGRDINTIRFNEWVGYFDNIASESPVNSANILKRVKTMLKWAWERRLIGDLEIMKLNPSVVGKASKVGDRVHSYWEMALIWREIERSKVTPSNRLILELIMMYGCRNSEMREVEWHDLDFREMVWTIPKHKSKTGEAIRRPIFPKAAEMFETAKTIYGTHRKFVFPSPEGGSKPITIQSINRFSGRIRAKLIKEVPKWTPHDFRRTLSTRLSEWGVLPHVTEKMLGHKLGGIMAVYNKHDWLEDQREAYNLHFNHLMKAVESLDS